MVARRQVHEFYCSDRNLAIINPTLSLDFHPTGHVDLHILNAPMDQLPAVLEYLVSDQGDDVLTDLLLNAAEKTGMFPQEVLDQARGITK